MKMRIDGPLPPETEELVQRVIGCAITVHRELGPGFLESIYDRAMCLELQTQGLRYECQKEILVRYKKHGIPGQRLDLIVEDQVIVELKAVREFDSIHQAQLQSYLKATGLRIGLLINFNCRLLKAGGIRRIIL